MFKTWIVRTVCGCWQFCVHQMFFEFLQPLRKICQGVVRIHPVIPLVSSVLVFWGWFAPVSWSSISSLRSDTLSLEDELEAGRMLSPAAISTSLLNESSLMAMLKTKALPESADNPWNDKRYEVVRLADSTPPIFGQPWLLTADPLTRVSVVFAKLFLAIALQAFPRVIARLRTDLDRQRTLVPPRGFALPRLAVIYSCRGISNFFTVSIFSELNSFFAHRVHWCSWIDYEFALLWSCRSGCQHCLNFNRSTERSFVRILELVNKFSPNPRRFAGASFLVARSPHVIFLTNFGAPGLRSWSAHFWIIPRKGPFPSRFLIWCSSAVGEFDGAFWSQLSFFT